MSFTLRAGLAQRYSRFMATLVLTVTGKDRAGLVSALADAIADHGGSWGHSQLTELAGRFAGIVTVEIPEGKAEELEAALRSLSGVRDLGVDTASEANGPTGEVIHLELVGNDRPGIVKEVTGALVAHGVRIESMETRTSSAPMAGGDLFELTAVLRPGPESDLSGARAALEALASELMVDLSLGDTAAR